MIKDIQYVYDDYHDQLWLTWWDLPMMCIYCLPMPTREIDMVLLVDKILKGEMREYFI